MRGNLFESSDVGCPFYKCEERTRIHCEGICGSASTQIVFADPKAKQEHKLTFCNEGYKRCPLYKLANAKYEEERE